MQAHLSFQRAWPFDELEKTGESVIRDQFAGQTVEVRFNAEARTAQVYSNDGEELGSRGLSVYG